MKRATTLLTALLMAASMSTFAEDDPTVLADFDSLDDNNDGYLNMEEVREVDLDGGFPDINSHSFHEMDSDGDELISREEFETAMD